MKVCFRTPVVPSNRYAAPTAMPSATASTASVNSSRDPVPATRPSSHGTVRRPTKYISARNAATFTKVTKSC